MHESFHHRDKRCCVCLSLERGVQLMIIGDLLFVVAFVALYSVSLWEQLTYAEEFNIIPSNYLVYWALTGGITSLLLLIKCTYGAKYLYYTSRSYRNRLEREIFGRKMSII